MGKFPSWPEIDVQDVTNSGLGFGVTGNLVPVCPPGVCDGLLGSSNALPVVPEPFVCPPGVCVDLGAVLGSGPTNVAGTAIGVASDLVAGVLGPLLAPRANGPGSSAPPPDVCPPVCIEIGPPEFEGQDIRAIIDYYAGNGTTVFPDTPPGVPDPPLVESGPPALTFDEDYNNLMEGPTDIPFGILDWISNRRLI